MTRIMLTTPIPEALADEVAKRVYFVSAAITGFTLVRSGGQVTAVDVTTRTADPGDTAELGRKLNRVLGTDVAEQRHLPPRVIWRSEGTGPVRDVFDTLVADGVAFETGEGQIAVGEPFLSLMDRLDALILALVTAEFAARDLRYPTLIRSDVLRRTGYLNSFPQLVMSVSRLHDDADAYRGFLDALGTDGDLSEAWRTHSGGIDYCLPPTMCFHTYQQYAERALPSPSTTVTARGKSFRFESRYRRSLERLWDFTIREVVFLGSRDFVLDARARLMDRAYALLDSLGLGGRCEVANDPFFLNGAAPNWSQRLIEAKYELRLPLDDSRDVAVGSFNLHDQHFATAFGIRTDAGEPAFTSCAGFGLERLTYAFLCRHGVDPAGWPAVVRQ
ncbi:hypothetical protein ACTOB_006436 [Actinoplanes oblitus]|uniref:Aminoacyl-transfer RNA synthetases class-II family profile domain-containing protein n=1 Tax=Actinoplanes oblitus TaxID=3040509 RepID=A0ABY8WBE7_9ACTN|nr:hypothetical protein [Actinoplanes oblitus]WIM94413.1 hypothetical protein ACTOB_006436 [Actinoplanes oblitus]